MPACVAVTAAPRRRPVDKIRTNLISKFNRQPPESPQREALRNLNLLHQTAAPYTAVAVVNGRIAMLRALLMAAVTSLWCLAQLPEILRGMIFPRSVIKYLRTLGFL